ncbi:phosphatase PAP2 family protein [Eubacterium limosum]|uniref:phosphatase PAP2 family protein n=1 Tax=Eubacterium limosum TaxID=1736 RepID=UPI0010645795|nr:phosphatase PAP2 family protein [Eubacterium limosum]
MDLTILLWIQAHMRCDVLDFIFTLITKLGNTGIIWILLTLILLIRKDTRYTGLVMAIAFILSAAVVNLGIKPLVSRPRPFQAHPIELAIAAPYGTSFPSGHSATSFAAAWAYFITRKNRLRWGLLALAAAIAFSRLYLFVHFPTDVLAGIIIGVILSYAAKLIADRLVKNGRWGIHANP